MKWEENEVLKNDFNWVKNVNMNCVIHEYQSKGKFLPF